MRSVDIEPATNRASRGVSGALEQATDAAVGWRGELPDQPSYRRLLDSDREYDGSVSLGSTSHGELENAVSLPPEGEHYEIIEKHRRRGLRWGTEEIVDALRRAADDVADQYPGSTMRVGNIGRRHGGDIAWSNSHNSGRDADLAFFARRASDGKRLPTPGLVDFDADGEAIGEPGLVFDVPRNWALVESLLTHPEVGIQWLFVSNSLKAKLLDYARRQGKPESLIRRAKHVLHQPSDAPPHNDHLHLRITCSEQDRLEGCLDYGPRWVWVDWHERPLLARTLELGEALEAPDPATRRRALEFMKRIRSPYAPEVALLEGVDDPNPKVRAAALETATDIRHWSDAAITATIDFIDDSSTPLSERREAYEILRRDHSRRARRFAFSRLLSDETPTRERIYAARALRHVMEPGLVPDLIDELDQQPPAVRQEIAKVVRRITGHAQTDGRDWNELSGRQLSKAANRWEQWWESARNRARDTWLASGLEEHGFEAGPSKVGELQSVDQLIPLLDDTPDHIAYNANRLIHRATDRWIPLEAWSYGRLHSYWQNWWRKNRQRVLEDESIRGFPDSVLAEY
jgi:penicillin-insensitive murein endopeptidase